MKELLDAYYQERRQNEALKGNIALLQAELKRVKENYDYVVHMSQNYKDISEEEKQAEIDEGKIAVHNISKPKYVIGSGAVPFSVTGVDASQHAPKGNINTSLVDYEYDTGHVIPRDDSHNWG